MKTVGNKKCDNQGTIGEMNTMRNDLIALVIISCILIVMIFTIHPLSDITLKDFGGLFGVIGYFVVKKLVDAYFAKKH
jgi:hypothetical protein